MEPMRAAVMHWIDDNFEPGSVDCKPFDGLPGGVIITDANGDEMLIYFDILTGEVTWT